jgi:energy-coupling factor transporter ATP-binding protein EcfA2
MSEFVWFEVVPPRSLTLEQVTALMRPLASRPKLGVLGLMPVVVFELWLRRDAAQWLIGVNEQIAVSVAPQLMAQMPGLHLSPAEDPQRPAQQVGCSLRIYSLAYPVRLDTAPAVTSGLLHIANSLSAGESAVVQWVVGPSFVRREHPEPFDLSVVLGFSDPRQPDATERTAWRHKIAEPLFGVRGRVGVSTRTTPKNTVTLRLMVSALHLANGPHARFRAGMPSARVAEKIATVIGPIRTWSSMVNAAELATVVGWPLDGVAVPASHGVRLSRAPATLTRDLSARSTERAVGASMHPADHQRLVAVPLATSTSHLHIIGPTGSGKSSLLAHLALADAAAGRPLLVMEPKGDLITDILERLPEKRHQDVVLIEPGSDMVVGFNPLRGPRADAERRADELLGLFRELFGASIGPRSADVLLHALITAARMPDGTLPDIPALLTNPAFRRTALATVNDPLVLAPFWAWYDQLGQAERGQVIAPIMNKLRALTTRAPIRRMLGQGRPAFSFNELFSANRIVLVNLNRGLLGPETTKLVGSLLLRQLYHVTQRRAATPTSQRRPAMVIIDEWQDFTAGLDFGDALAQFRGLSVGLTLAHQHLDQLPPDLRAAVIANARSRVVFRPATGDTKALAGVLGADVQPADLAALGAYQAAVRLLVDAQVSPAFTVRTLPLPKPTTDPAAIRQESRERYGVNGSGLDEQLQARWQNSAGGVTDGPVGLSPRNRP